MASFSSSAAVLALCFVLFIAPSLSQTTCSTKKFSSKKTFDNCTDLPVLSSSLHYTYDVSNSSLSIAFVAAPEKPDGWVAWAINPSSTGMVGSQALIAFTSDGKLTVKTYDVKSYSGVKEGKLSFDVWDLSAESVDGNFVIFATVKVPEKAESVNQVWQVGSYVTDGIPDRHFTNGDNLKSTGVLKLAAGGSGGSGAAVAPSVPTPGGGVPNPSGGGGGAAADKGGAYRCVVSWFGVFGLVIGSLVVGF